MTALLTDIVQPPSKVVLWHRRIPVSMQKLRYMSRNSEYVNRGINIDVSDSEWSRSKCLDCIEATMHTVTSHRKIDHSIRQKGKYWGADTTGQQDVAILSGNRYKPHSWNLLRVLL